MVRLGIIKLINTLSLFYTEAQNLGFLAILYMRMGRVCGADGARHYPHITHDLRSGCQDHHPSTNSVQKTIRCNSTSNAPDDGRMYPKHAELRIH